MPVNITPQQKLNFKRQVRAELDALPLGEIAFVAPLQAQVARLIMLGELKKAYQSLNTYPPIKPSINTAVANAKALFVAYNV